MLECLNGLSGGNSLYTGNYLLDYTVPSHDTYEENWCLGW